MYPVLLKFGSIEIFTYGAFLAAGILAAILLGRWQTRRLGYPVEIVTDVAFIMLVCGLAGARLFYVVTKLDFFLENPLAIVRLWEGGMVYYGGLIGAAAGLMAYILYHRLPVLLALDVCAPCIALGHFLGRLGCFFAGCCFGKICDLPWAVTFTNERSLAPLHFALHPTQIYMAVYNLMIFGALWFFRHRKPFDGSVFGVYLIFYGVCRFSVEFWRNDFRGAMLVGNLSISQLISIAMVATAIVAWPVLKRKAPLTEQ